jgi:cation transport regulator
MPYKNTGDLPENVRQNLPPGARAIFKEAYNSAWEQYSDESKRKGDSGREETANRVAWSAVKKKYRKNEKGDWVRKQ